MTVNQIKKALKKANVSLEGLEIARDEVTVCIGYTEEYGFGRCDNDATHKKYEEVEAAIPQMDDCIITGYSAMIGRFNAVVDTNYRELCRANID